MKRILFVCVENSCRSQIAEGFARALGNENIEAHSAGSRPSGTVNPAAIEIMAEVGIDISRAQSKGFDAVSGYHFDYAVSMGCNDMCPVVMADEHRYWQIADPKGKPVEFFREVRDTIRDKVKELLTMIDASRYDQKEE